MGRYDMDIGPSLSDLMTQKAIQQAQIGAIGQESQLRQLQMQTAQRSAQDTEQMRALLPQLMKSGDPQGTLKSLMMSGNPQAMEMAGKMAPILASLQKDNTITYEDFGGYKQGRNAQGALVGDRIEKTPSPRDIQPLDIERVMESQGIQRGSPKWNSVLNQYMTKQTTHQPGTTVTYGAPVSGVDANNNPVFFQPSKGGGAPSIIPGVKPSQDGTGKAPTESESKAAFYAQNMKSASVTLDKLEAAGYDPTKSGTQLDTRLAGGMTNAISSKAAQMAKQTQSQWSEMMLRMLTGAAATTDEINRNNATYFPQYGDDAGTVAQKKIMRKQAEEGVLAASGRAASRVKELDAQPSSAQKTANSLPNPSTLPNGAIVTDTVSGRRMVVNNGKYQPAR